MEQHVASHFAPPHFEISLSSEHSFLSIDVVSVQCKTATILK